MTTSSPLVQYREKPPACQRNVPPPGREHLTRSGHLQGKFGVNSGYFRVIVTRESDLEKTARGGAPRPHGVYDVRRSPVALEKLWAVRQLGESSAEGVSQIEITVTV